MSPQDLSEPTQIVTDTVAALVAAGAGSVAAGAPGAMIGGGSGPVLTAAMRGLVGRVQGWRARRSGEAFSLAAELAGLSEDEFASRLSSDEQLAELAARVFVSVQDVVLPEKRKALARALARATAASVDPSNTELSRGFVLATAIAALDELHIRVMALLEPYRGFVPEPPHPNMASEDPLGMTFMQIEAADAGLAGLGSATVHWLITHGVVEDVVVGMVLGSEQHHLFALTQLGHDVLTLLR